MWLLGKLLERAESGFPLQNGENNSTFFMGILHSALHLVRIEQVLTFAHFFLFALSSPNFRRASLFPAVPLHSTNPQARAEDVVPLIRFPGNQVTRVRPFFNQTPLVLPLACLSCPPKILPAPLPCERNPSFCLIWRCLQTSWS